MKAKQLSAKSKKICILLHLIFLIIALTGITLSYLNDNFGSGILGIFPTSYSDTESCGLQLESDIDDIFQYILYQNVFETDGTIDFSKPILSVQSGPGEDAIYTVDEMIRYAKNKGYYLDESYQVIGGANNYGYNDNFDMFINWRTYLPNIRYKEPGEAYATMEELSVEILTYLGKYYVAKEKFFEQPTNLYFTVSYQANDGEQTIYSNANNQSIEQLKALGSYFYITGDSVRLESNMNHPPVKVASLLESHNTYQNSNYYMVLGLDNSFSQPDSYAKAADEFKVEHTHYALGFLLLCIGGMGSLLTLYYAFLLTRKNSQANQNSIVVAQDGFSFETGIIITCLIALLGYYISDKFLDRLLHLLLSEEYWYYGHLLLRIVISYLCIITQAFHILKLHYTNTLKSNSHLVKIFNFLSNYLLHCTFSAYVIVTYLIYIISNAILIITLIYLWFRREVTTSWFIFGVLTICLIIGHIIVLYQLLKDAYSKGNLEEAIYHLSSGNTGYQIELTGYSGKDRILAEQVNKIGSGLEVALQEKVKSERLKADLITNVSHDIKTPLTSIINYVDLLKREHIQNEKIQQYLEVLDQKSQRLKTLTEDLVEASKASSGNIKLETTSINFVELIQQTTGEFEENFSLRHLTLVTTVPEDMIYIDADGRRLWRVLENLYNNSFKYAMPYSRVYVDVRQDQKAAIFTIKNVSEHPLNINPAELTERFVRGDVSRTTEGSGLGLSIARSLTQIQNGEFEIYIDGDLFKAELRFPIKETSTSTLS